MSTLFQRSWRLSLLVLLLVVVALLGAGGAPAATLTVCTSGCQYATIAGALAAASNGDTIAVGPGTYSGGFTIDVSVRLVGAGQHVTRISGGDSVITIGSAATVTISRVTISNGQATQFGGGIDNEGTLTLRMSTLSGNVAGGFFPGEGGGIFNDAGRLTLAHSTVTDNVATEGGGIRNLAGTVVVINSRISGNSAAGGALPNPNGLGGGIANAGTIILIHSAVLRNTAVGDAAAGGGILNELGGVATLTNSRVEGNTAFSPIIIASGGGISNGGSMRLVNTPVMANNVSCNGPALGGGIDNGGALTLINSPLTANSATAFGSEGLGGGIFNSSGGEVRLTNSPVTSNRVSAPEGVPIPAKGGGIFNEGSLRLANSPVTANSAISPSGEADGGGIFNFPPGTVTLINSPVTGNQPDDCVGC